MSFQNPEIVDRLHDLASAAKYLDVHEKSIRRWIAAGKINAFRLNGKIIRIRQSELDRMLTPIPTGGSR